MKIKLAFQKSEEGYTLVGSYDEYTADVWGGVPDFYLEELKSAEGNGPTRECWISVDDETVEDLFAVPTVEANWEEAP